MHRGQSGRQEAKEGTTKGQEAVLRGGRDATRRDSRRKKGKR